MRRVLGVTAALCVSAATLVLLLGSAQAEGTTVRVMPLGDSITDGYNLPGGYRIDLEDALVADGDSFDFVGSLSNGPVVLADKNHEGHTGFRIDELSSSINDWLTSAQPDVVLLMIGTNDVLQDYQLATAPNRLAALADQIHAARPQTKLLLASIPPVGTATDDQQVRSYNSAIPDLVQSRAAQGRPISFVDMYQAVTTADLADGVHPNATGYSKIASVWHSALASVFGGTQPPATEPPSVTTTTLPSATVGVAYSATLQATGGSPPYVWSVDAGGSLPSGLALNCSTGAITGTPTSAGTWTFTARVTDSVAQADTQTLSAIVVVAPLAITTTTLSDGTAGWFYSQNLEASGGTPPYAWSLVSGTLPPGLTLSASGMISGTPTKHVPVKFTVRVTAGASLSKELSIRINR